MANFSHSHPPIMAGTPLSQQRDTVPSTLYPCPLTLRPPLPPAHHYHFENISGSDSSTNSIGNSPPSINCAVSTGNANTCGSNGLTLDLYGHTVASSPALSSPRAHMHHPHGGVMVNCTPRHQISYDTHTYFGGGSAAPPDTNAVSSCSALGIGLIPTSSSTSLSNNLGTGLCAAGLGSSGVSVTVASLSTPTYSQLGYNSYASFATSQASSTNYNHHTNADSMTSLTNNSNTSTSSNTESHNGNDITNTNQSILPGRTKALVQHTDTEQQQLHEQQQETESHHQQQHQQQFFASCFYSPWV